MMIIEQKAGRFHPSDVGPLPSTSTHNSTSIYPCGRKGNGNGLSTCNAFTWLQFSFRQMTQFKGPARGCVVAGSWNKSMSWITGHLWWATPLDLFTINRRPARRRTRVVGIIGIDDLIGAKSRFYWPTTTRRRPVDWWEEIMGRKSKYNRRSIHKRRGKKTLIRCNSFIE